MKKEFIVNRQGRDFVLYAGLLDQAHQEGLKRITTKLLQAPTEANGQLAISYAEVETEKGIFGGIGDASPQNVGRMIAVHTVRMSETRAKARALRDAINVGVTALEEMADIEEDGQPEQVRRATKVSAPPAQEKAPPARPQPAPARPVAAPGAAPQAGNTGPATSAQIDRLMKLRAALGQAREVPDGLSFEAAAHEITELVRRFNAQARGGRQATPRPPEAAATHADQPATAAQRKRITTLQQLLSREITDTSELAGAAEAEALINELEAATTRQQASEAQYNALTDEVRRVKDAYGRTMELPDGEITVAQYAALRRRLVEIETQLKAGQPVAAGAPA